MVVMFFINHGKVYVTSCNMKHEKVRKCGKESLVPVIMAMDSLAAGSDTTGFIHNIFCLNLLTSNIFS